MFIDFRVVLYMTDQLQCFEKSDRFTTVTDILIAL
jgi:hypothetical protein